MKVKKYLSVFAVVCAGALTLAGCSDYDNGYNEAAIKFQEEFKNTFGDIDPEQDWNLAERASVTVNTQQASNIKIYALSGDEYAIVGNYEGVNGTRLLGVDIIEGTTSLLVTDGRTAQKCAPGDVVVFNGMNTRTTYEGTTNDFVTVSKLREPVTIGNVTYPVYRYATTQEELDALTAVIPEGQVNLTKVTHDFSYVSTGSFIIYPYYWVTSSRNTIGVYYYDDNGNKVEVDVYTAKEANGGELGELTYEDAYDGSTVVINETLSSLTKENHDNTWPDGWTISNGAGVGNFHYNLHSTESDKSGMVTPFIEYWRWRGNDPNVNLENCTIERLLTGLEPGNYKVEIDVRLFNEGKTNTPSGVTFFAQDKTINLSNACEPATYNNTSGEIYGHLTLDVVTVNSDGQLDLGFHLNNVQGNWLAFKNLKVSKMGTWKTAVDQGKNKVRRSQGIKIDIPAGTKFGMYLKKDDPENPSYQFYSEGELNYNTDHIGSGIVYSGSGNVSERKNWNTQAGLHPCHASTFHVGDQMFLGFEDWPNDANVSDFDLNDIVLAFEGATPTIINEDPETFTWMLACEDLGGTFDRDYNDVVFRVQHVSGQESAIVTPLAAGGTLASYIFYVHPSTQAETCLGEIHQLFGFPPALSGEYEPHNAGARFGGAGSSVTIKVPADWSMAKYSSDTFDSDSYYNMGGFELRTLPLGVEDKGNLTVNSPEFSGASRIPAPDDGAAPYIICLPYSYVENNKPSTGWKTETFWEWPQEMMLIDYCYTDFPGWVSNHQQNKEWYKNKDQNAAVVAIDPIVSPSSSTKKPSPLGNRGDIVVKQNNYVDFARNLTDADVTGGALTYYYKWTLDGNLIENNDNGKDKNRSWMNPGQTGERYIVVKQAETNEYEAGETMFKMTVNTTGKKASTLSNKGDIIVAMGQTVHFADNLINANLSSGAITYKVIYDNTTYSDWGHDNGNSSTSIAPNRGGAHTIVVTQAEDDNYEAGETRFTVTAYQPTMITWSDNNGKNLALSWYNGNLAFMNTNTYNNYQKWLLVDANDGDYFFLYNIGAQAYLAFNTSDSNGISVGQVSWVANPPYGNHGAKFMFDGNNRIYVKAKAGQSRYFGSSNEWKDGTVIFWADKPERSINNWTRSNVSLAKKRM